MVNECIMNITFKNNFGLTKENIGFSIVKNGKAIGIITDIVEELVYGEIYDNLEFKNMMLEI